MNIKETHHRDKFKKWIKTISFLLVFTFLWQNIVWANPNLATNTLSQRTLFTSEDMAIAFKKWAIFTVHKYITKLNNEKHIPHLSHVDEALDVLNKTAISMGIREPVVKGDIGKGAIKIVFHDKDELLFYDPHGSVVQDSKGDYNSDPWDHTYSLDKQVQTDIEINTYLREQFIKKIDISTVNKNIPAKSEKIRLSVSPKGKLPNYWMCFPDSDTISKRTALQDLFNITKSEKTEKEIAGISYEVKGNTLIINEFSVNKEYREKGIASALLAHIISPLAKEDRITRIRFNYECMRAFEFLRGIANPSGNRLIIGPLLDEKGEYYWLGEYFLSPEKAKDPFYEDIKPDVLIEITKDLIASMHPEILHYEEAIELLQNAINKISIVANCRSLYIYNPALKENMKPIVAYENSGVHVWNCTYELGKHKSKIHNVVLPGEKHVLEMMIMQGETERLNVKDKDGKEIARYKNDIWEIFDRYALQDMLKDDEELAPIIRQDKDKIDSDIEQYGESGNSICYALPVGQDNKPLFLFAIHGRLKAQQIEM